MTSIAKRAALGVAMFASAILVSEPAWAHSVGDSAAGFTAGFLHPFTGLDHLLAMVSVGIWVRSLGHRRSGCCRSPFR